MKIYQYTLTAHCVCEEAPVERIEKPEDIISYMKGAFDFNPDAEQFWIIFCNRANVIKGRFLMTIGTQNSVGAHPRDVLRAVLLSNSCSFAVVHNHPGGDPVPSSPDLHVTRLLRDASRAVDLTFLDHVIIGDPTIDPNGKGWFSFRENGVI